VNASGAVGASGAASAVSAASGHAAGSGAAPNPPTFVAVSTNPNKPGLTVYSSATGKAVRRLTRGDRAAEPMLSPDRRWVYFAGPERGNDCTWELWRVPLAGGRLEPVASAGEIGDTLAISPDGRALAYTVAPGGPCEGRAGDVAVEVVDLRTGRRHRIEGETTALAWAPNGTLAVVTPVAPTAAGRIRLISDPFRAGRVTAAAPLACPTQFVCDEESPSFDRRGDLVYVAEISPRPGNYCFVGVCSAWTYALVSVAAGSGSTVLASVVRRDAETTDATVDDSGGAVIFTLPMTNGYPRVWRWSAGGRPVTMPAPGAFSSQPAW
jgi:dipeptidyl aminopeptidase/acylaminoacyl peptidase